MGLRNKDAFIHIGIVGRGCGISSGEIDYGINAITHDICKDKKRKAELINMIDTLKKVIEENY